MKIALLEQIIAHFKSFPSHRRRRFIITINSLIKKIRAQCSIAKHNRTLCSYFLHFRDTEISKTRNIYIYNSIIFQLPHLLQILHSHHNRSPHTPFEHRHVCPYQKPARKHRNRATYRDAPAIVDNLSDNTHKKRKNACAYC